VKINPIRRPAELNDNTRLEQFAGRLNSGNVILPESLQTREKPFPIASRALIEKINVTSESRIAVKDDCFTPDNDVTDFESGQQPNELDNVW
jgi:hypothetical protein